jgi:hypothetical protein
MAILLLHRCSGAITLEAGTAAEYALDHGFDVAPATLDGDECVKLLRAGDWVATAQPVVLSGRVGTVLPLHATCCGYRSIPLSRLRFRLRAATRTRSGYAYRPW